MFCNLDFAISRCKSNKKNRDSRKKTYFFIIFIYCSHSSFNNTLHLYTNNIPNEHFKTLKKIKLFIYYKVEESFLLTFAPKLIKRTKDYAEKSCNSRVTSKGEDD